MVQRSHTSITPRNSVYHQLKSYLGLPFNQPHRIADPRNTVHVVAYVILVILCVVFLQSRTTKALLNCLIACNFLEEFFFPYFQFFKDSKTLLISRVLLVYLALVEINEPHIFNS